MEILDAFGASLFFGLIVITLAYEIVDTAERSRGVEVDSGTASAMPDTGDSARCVWVGSGRSGSATTGSLA